MSYLEQYRRAATDVINQCNFNQLESIISRLQALKQGGRLFILGVGGSAANASHAVNDFRSIAGIEAYTPVDNIAEITATTNDDHFDHVFTKWLACSRLNAQDVLMIFSVGGGCFKAKLSLNLCHAVDYALAQQADRIVITSRAESYCLSHANYPMLVSVADKSLLTPLSEAMQAVIWHAMVSHPKLKTRQMTWETIENESLPTTQAT